MIQDNANITTTIYYRYALEVMNGTRTSCTYVKLAVERFFKDLEREDLVFCPAKVRQFAEFCVTLRHYKSPFEGKIFRLLPWQSFFVANVFGFYRWKTMKDGRKKLVRRFHYADLDCARKTGKSSLVAAIALYGLLADGEASASVQIGATSRKQAGEMFSMCCNYLRPLDPHGRFARIYRNSIEVKSTSSSLICLSSDASRLDGGNASIAICDEAAAHKTNALYSVLKSSQASRENPLLICLTTAQFDKTNFYYQKRQVDIEILNGLKEDDETFALIYTLDEGDDYEDPAVWEKSQPSLNETVDAEFMASQVRQAKNDSSQSTAIKTKTFNLWCDDVAKSWIDEKYVLNSMRENNEKYKFNFEDYRECLAYVGVDLSAVNDVTGLSLMFFDENKEKFVFKNYAFLPEETIKNHPNREYYKELVRLGYLTLTRGNVVDYSALINVLMQIQRDYGIVFRYIGYDPWSSQSFCIACREASLALKPIGQGMSTLSGPTKEFTRMMMNGQALIDANPMVAWMFSNVTVKEDWNQNIKIVKVKDADKIDLCVCMIECLYLYLQDYGRLPYLGDVE